METREKVRFQSMPGGLVVYVEDLRALLQELADKVKKDGEALDRGLGFGHTWHLSEKEKVDRAFTLMSLGGQNMALSAVIEFLVEAQADAVKVVEGDEKGDVFHIPPRRVK